MPTALLERLGQPSGPAFHSYGVCMSPKSDSHVDGGTVQDLTLDQWAKFLGLKNKTVLTTKETARVLRISERHVRHQIKAGTIPSVRFGRRLLVPVPMLILSLVARDQELNENGD